MTDNQKIKISISILTAMGIVGSQKELAAKMGYDDPSSFSQIINGHVPTPKKFIEKLRLMHKYVDVFWESGLGEMPLTETLSGEHQRLINEKRQLEDRLKDKDKIIQLLQARVDELEPSKNKGRVS